MSTLEPVFRDIDVLLATPITARQKRVLAAFGNKIGRLSHGTEEPETLVGAELGPAKKGGLGARFHIDVDEGTKRERTWMVAHVLLFPSTNRLTSEARAKRSQGFTSDWLVGQIGEIIGDESIPCDVSVQGRASHAIFKPGALPVLVGGQALAPSGLEFRRTGEASEGMMTARVRQLPDGALDFALRYRITAPWSIDLWERETQRSSRYLADLLIALA